MIAMFMVLFGQENFIKFNSAAKSHFKEKEKEFQLKTDAKENAVRVWQKINEYQKDSYWVQL